MSKGHCKGCDEPIALDQRLCADCQREGVKVPLDNAEFMEDLLTWCRNPLVHVMVLQAVEEFATAVAASKPEDYKQDGMVNPAAWIDAGREIVAKFKERREGQA
jgi:hypothetical protein